MAESDKKLNLYSNYKQVIYVYGTARPRLKGCIHIITVFRRIKKKLKYVVH